MFKFLIKCQEAVAGSGLQFEDHVLKIPGVLTIVRCAGGTGLRLAFKNNAPYSTGLDEETWAWFVAQSSSVF